MGTSITEYRCKRCGGNNFHYSVLFQNIRSYKVLPNGYIEIDE